MRLDETRGPVTDHWYLTSWGWGRTVQSHLVGWQRQKLATSLFLRELPNPGLSSNEHELMPSYFKCNALKCLLYCPLLTVTITPDVRQECKGCLQTQLHFLFTIQLFRSISAQWRTGSSGNSLRNIDQSVHPSERTFTHPSLERPLKYPSVHSSHLICHPYTLTCNNYSSIHQFKHLSIYPPIDHAVCWRHVSQEGRPNP